MITGTESRTTTKTRRNTPEAPDTQAAAIIPLMRERRTGIRGLE
jgi:hypothetical protein